MMSDFKKEAIIIQKCWRSFIVRKQYKDLLKKARKRKMVIGEVMLTEIVYVDALEVIVDVFDLYFNNVVFMNLCSIFLTNCSSKLVLKIFFYHKKP
jgi:hypothetical protein